MPTSLLLLPGYSISNRMPSEPHTCFNWPRNDLVIIRAMPLHNLTSDTHLLTARILDPTSLTNTMWAVLPDFRFYPKILGIFEAVGIFLGIFFPRKNLGKNLGKFREFMIHCFYMKYGWLFALYFLLFALFVYQKYTNFLKIFCKQRENSLPGGPAAVSMIKTHFPARMTSFPN